MNFSISPASASDLERIPDIEARAAALFQQIEGLVIPTGVRTLAELRRGLEAGLLWVARDEGGLRLGFALATLVDERMHLEELGVLPEFGRRGVGTGLVRQVIEEARLRGLPGLTLCTYRDVPWNAPFYRHLGFRALRTREIGPELLRKMADEARQGLAPALRVAMIRPSGS
jgi:GNAT superfamily N-acetyltransferase